FRVPNPVLLAAWQAHQEFPECPLVDMDDILSEVLLRWDLKLLRPFQLLKYFVDKQPAHARNAVKQDVFLVAAEPLTTVAAIAEGLRKLLKYVQRRAGPPVTFRLLGPGASGSLVP